MGTAPLDYPRPNQKVKIRLQKYLADCGVASRRASEAIIQKGRVAVDGQTVTELGTKVEPGQSVTVDGKSVRPEIRRIFAFNKPPRVMCTSSDPEGRATFLEFFQTENIRLYSVGRLDFMSDGLLLVTNEGDLAHRLTHPSFHLEKEYKVKTETPFTKRERDKLVEGIKDDGEWLQAVSIRSDTRDSTISHWVLTEGKNRQIRRMAAAQKKTILRLTRTRIGPLKLGPLKLGSWRELSTEDRDQLLKTAQQ